MATSIMMDDLTPVESLQCMEVWGGNGPADESFTLAGLAVWLHSKPFQNAARGGDVYYFSACSPGVIARVALADVSGHGDGASELAQTLRGLMQKYVTHWDQTEFMQELNRAFGTSQGRLPGQQGGLPLEGAKFATSTILGYYRNHRRLLVTNAGHLPPLHYSALDGDWHFLDEQARFCEPTLTGLPLGLIPGTHYSQAMFQLMQGDMVVLYTDGVTETLNASGAELDSQGLLTMARATPIGRPAELGVSLLEAVRQFGAGSNQADDETLIVIGCEA
jgi:phosphoserine phosphatase RsbU/P